MGHRLADVGVAASASEKFVQDREIAGRATIAQNGGNFAALVVVDASRDDGSGTPAGPVDKGAATELASDFMDAVAAYDADRAASYLADDARIQLRTSTLDAESMAPQLRWTRAAGGTPHHQKNRKKKTKKREQPHKQKFF